jgi:hypothetical protein
MNTTSACRPRRITSTRRPLPMGTAEFLDYLVSHPATSRLGRRFADIVSERHT